MLDEAVAALIKLRPECRSGNEHCWCDESFGYEINQYRFHSSGCTAANIVVVDYRKKYGAE